MSYDPKEGIDYIVDLYAVAGASQEATPEELKQSLNERTREYHPDRLQGVAPEFRTKGERMAVLLNKARHILLDGERRGEYDEILGAWDGPLSTDGTPVITMNRALQMDMADKTPDEIEGVFTAQAAQIEGMTGYNPSRLSFLESLIEKSGGEVDDALRTEYEDALLQRDRTLAIQEAERSRLLGLPDIEKDRYVAALGYGEQIEERVETARTERKEQLQMQALGGVSTRLALLAGDGAPTEAGAIIPADTTLELPAYFDTQAAKVKEIAKEREGISEKRLANYLPSYPEAELQTEFREDLAIGVSGKMWLGAKIDTEELHANIAGLPNDVKELLEQDDFKAVIEKGFNVLTIEPLEQIDMQDLIISAIEKYIDKYSPSDEAE
jgi:hypothetical protein